LPRRPTDLSPLPAFRDLVEALRQIFDLIAWKITY
jgi:hypothetical protein